MDPDRVSVMYDLRRRLRRGHSEDIFQHFLKLGGYSSLAALLAFLLHIVMARMLGPELYSIYGVFSAALFAGLLALSGVHLVISRFVSYHRSRFQFEQINYIVSIALKYVAILGFILFLLLIVFAGRLVDFFHLTSTMPVILFGFALWFTLIVPVFEGAFKGMEEFQPLGIFRVVEQLARLLLSVILVFLGFRLFGALIALGVGTLLGLIYAYRFIYKIQKRKVVAPDLRPFWNFAPPVFVAMVTIAFMISFDAFLVKHFFTPEIAGMFVAASLLAKIPFYLAMVFVGVLFPKVVVLHADGKNSIPVLRNALQVLVPTVLAFTIIGFFFTDWFLHLFFGSGYNIGFIFGFYVFGVGCLALSMLLITYLLAVQQEKFVYALPVFFILLVALILQWHSSLFEVLVSVLLAHTGLTAYTLFMSRNILEFDFFL